VIFTIHQSPATCRCSACGAHQTGARLGAGEIAH
jgi:hypothetical protein